MPDYDYLVGRIMDLEDRVERLERGRGVEAWEDMPRRNPAPMMAEDRGEMQTLPVDDEIGAGMSDKAVRCDPTGTDPLPVTAAAETGYAVYNRHGPWKP